MEAREETKASSPVCNITHVMGMRDPGGVTGSYHYRSTYRPSIPWIWHLESVFSPNFNSNPINRNIPEQNLAQKLQALQLDDNLLEREAQQGELYQNGFAAYDILAVARSLTDEDYRDNF